MSQPSETHASITLYLPSISGLEKVNSVKVMTAIHWFTYKLLEYRSRDPSTILKQANTPSYKIALLYFKQSHMMACYDLIS